MEAISTVPVLDCEFWAVVLADPDLLDEAFAEVLASWHAGLPPSPPRTLVTNSDRANPVPPKRPGKICRMPWRSLLLPLPRPRVARSPPPWITPKHPS
ncbi:MAG TPA: hypothetical protein VMS00_01035 [Acidimicrobiales bacterium]|nr:hypothetical protein [Acidimicrobiales bacterium]